ncbi:hypothetical protein EB093_01825 [bacterium]|nr:hypothetical protein [bacterium]
MSSPGGTTLAGLDVFDRGNIAARFTDVIRAAADRSRELSHSSSAN